MGSPVRIRPWSLILAGSGVVLITAGVCWWVRPHPSNPLGVTPALPRLVLDASPRDLGVVLPGAALSLQYEIQNPGGRELNISELHTSCGCAPARLDRNPIPPGEKAVITVSFHAPPVAGPVTHLLNFRTDDPDHPNVECVFQAMAKRSVEVVPPHVYVGVLLCSQKVIHEVELCSTDAVPFEVRAIRPSASWVHVEALPGQARYRHVFRVSVEGQAQPGPFSESIEFTTSCPKQEQIVVPVVGEVASGLRISPASLLLHSAAAGSTLDGKMTITASGDTPPLETVTIKSTDWQVLSWKTERASPSAWRLCFRVRVPSAVGYKRTSLVLRGPSVQEVPLSCLVSRAEPTKQ
ncbi:MAG TPA: DUF1573 domain-containing protein [Gemmataceae bacterium]|nr:DUF1573 domain-containing protein [Gemmataceae bacterium]